MSRSTVVLLSVWLAACAEGRDRHVEQAAGDASSDADIGEPTGPWEPTDAEACPSSGEPAIDGCPCFMPPGDYCCRVGEGMTCTSERVWRFFFDGPCYSPPEADDDAGQPYPEPIDVVQCLR